MTSSDDPDLTPLWEAALPADAPGAWIREAIEAMKEDGPMADEVEAKRLARMIKQAKTGSWCSTQPLTIATYLLDQGVVLPEEETTSLSPASSTS